MSTRFELAGHLPVTGAELVRRLADPMFVLGRLQAGERSGAFVRNQTVDADGVRIVTRSRTPVDRLPRWLISWFPDGGPLSERSETWTIDGGLLRAKLRIESLSGGATFDGCCTVVDDGQGSAWRVDGVFAMRVPIVRHWVEGFAVAELPGVFAREADFVAADAARRRARPVDPLLRAMIDDGSLRHDEHGRADDRGAGAA